tara:strand:- start:268 stop:429 length:162 start_codon:yes stop_codon:yes gene_type:complete
VLQEELAELDIQVELVELEQLVQQQEELVVLDRQALQVELVVLVELVLVVLVV